MVIHLNITIFSSVNDGRPVCSPQLISRLNGCRFPVLHDRVLCSQCPETINYRLFYKRQYRQRPLTVQRLATLAQINKTIFFGQQVGYCWHWALTVCLERCLSLAHVLVGSTKVNHQDQDNSASYPQLDRK